MAGELISLVMLLRSVVWCIEMGDNYGNLLACRDNKRTVWVAPTCTVSDGASYGGPPATCSDETPGKERWQSTTVSFAMLPRMNLATRASDPTLKAMLRLAIFLNVFIKFKNESKLMWLIDRVFARLFNATFMTRFTTTFGATVYFTDEEAVLANQLQRAKTLAHEFVHVHDKREHGFIKYDLAYLFPQILAIPAIFHLIPGLLVGAFMPGMISAWIAIGLTTLVTAPLGFFLIGPWTLILLAFLIFAAPIPAYWRMKWEMRGYTMSLAMNYWKHGSIMPSTVEWMATHFTSMNYYAMWPFKKSMMRRLYVAVDDIKSDKVLDDPIFQQIHDAMKTPPPENIAP